MDTNKDANKRLDTLTDEFKLIKGELKQTLSSIHDYLMNRDMAAPEYNTLMAALEATGGGGGTQKVELKGNLALPSQPNTIPEPPHPEPPHGEAKGTERGNAKVVDEKETAAMEEEKLAVMEEEEMEEEDEDEEPGEEHAKPRAGYAKSAAGMKIPVPPVNLLASLIRWVSVAKKELGIQQLCALLEIYGISGNLSPEVKDIVLHLAEISEDPSAEARTSDVWSRLILELHGILVGGEAPLYPLGSFLKNGDGKQARNSEEETKAEDKEKTKGKGNGKDKVQPMKLKLMVLSENGVHKQLSIDLNSKDSLWMLPGA